MKLSAVIFDLNGTVLEDEDEYGKAFNIVLKSLGVETGVTHPHTAGIGVEANWPLLNEKYKLKTDKTPEELAKLTQDAYLSQISKVTIRTGFEDFVQSLKDDGIKIALATSNSWTVTDEILHTLNLTDVFEVVTTEEEVLHNKPDPDLFLLTSDKLGVDRADCLVIEDSKAGIMAAHRAGMKAVGITREEDLKEVEGADLIVEGFSEITSKAIDSL